MNQLILHIEYLLHQHNCVIVPGFGGFVVNIFPTYKEELSIFHPSHCELVFNRSLTHNDGLLVESYMRIENIPFELASQRIEKAVKDLKCKLREAKQVNLGELGEMKLTEDDRYLYKPNTFMRPEYYGLFTSSLAPIIHLKPKSIDTAKPFIDRKNIFPKVSVGAAIAAMIAIIFFIFPMQDSVKQHQSAKMLSETNLFSKTERQKNRANLYDNYDIDLSANHNAYSDPNSNSNNIVASESSKEKQYYVIVGVYEVREIADKMIEKLKSDGFNECNTIEKPNRIDVYAVSFSSKQEAENMAKEMRQNFDIYKDAWVK